MYVWMHVGMKVCDFVELCMYYTCLYMCVCVSVYVCISVCMYVCVYVCMYLVCGANMYFGVMYVSLQNMYTRTLISCTPEHILYIQTCIISVSVCIYKCVCMYVQGFRAGVTSYNNSCSIPPLKTMLPVCSSGSPLQFGKQYNSAQLHTY